MCIIQAICVAYLWHSQAPAQHITVGIGPGTVVGKVTVGYGQEKVGKNQVGKVIRHQVGKGSREKRRERVWKASCRKGSGKVWKGSGKGISQSGYQGYINKSPLCCHQPPSILVIPNNASNYQTAHQ